MYGKTLAAPPSGVQPIRFTLRQVGVWTVVACVILALLTQFGTVWGAVLWLAASAAAIGIGVYRGKFQWTALGIGLGLVGYGLYLPVSSCGDGRASSCQNNLIQIGIALHNYHDTYGSFPPAYVADASGRPMHSWRVLILPFLEQKPLYDRYDFSEPWDGPNNSLLAAEMPKVYRCPSDTRTTPPLYETSYVAVVGPETIWPGEKAISMADVPDGISQTLLVVEVHDSGINWLEPRDLHMLQMPLAVNPLRGQGISSRHSKDNNGHSMPRAHVLRADGSVTTLFNDTRPATLRAMLTVAGKETATEP